MRQMDCSTCGFSAAQWSPADIKSTLQMMPRWYDLLAEDASPDLLRALVPIGDRMAALRSADPHLRWLHDGLHALHEAGRCRQIAGEGARPVTGRVIQLNVSGGGVPKQPVPSASVSAAGMSGDAQNDREHHGRPWQALCLWSAEVIDALAAEGHPIGYGRAGENVTVAGIDWSTMRPGVRMKVGSVLLETTPYAIPCRKNAQWFTGGDFGRMSHERQPGVSRIYAQVIVGGSVAVGAPVVVEPKATPDAAYPVGHVRRPRRPPAAPA